MNRPLVLNRTWSADMFSIFQSRWRSNFLQGPPGSRGAPGQPGSPGEMVRPMPHILGHRAHTHLISLPLVSGNTHLTSPPSTGGPSPWSRNSGTIDMKLVLGVQVAFFTCTGFVVELILLWAPTPKIQFLFAVSSCWSKENAGQKSIFKRWIMGARGQLTFFLLFREHQEIGVAMATQDQGYALHNVITLFTSCCYSFYINTFEEIPPGKWWWGSRASLRMSNQLFADDVAVFRPIERNGKTHRVTKWLGW